VGIREAASELVLFTDDDIIPGPTLVAEHLDWHRRFPELSTAVLGQVTWDPDVDPTPFMKWYGSDGALFGFAHLAGRTEISYKYLYSCNLSLKTEFLRKYGTFDEDFKVAAYEDSELGYRLGKAGMRLFYKPEALAYHYQHVSFDDACRRAKKASAAEAVFRQKEAGLHLYASRPTSALSRLKRHFAKPVAVVLWPLKGLMDRRMPLPWGVYRAVFRVYS
jgi:GT2 family glycosyltransferase